MSKGNEPHGFPGDEDYEEGNYEDADSLLGAPVPSVSFAEMGAKVTGTIVAVDTGDQRDPDGKVRTFANGQVRRQVILTLQTKERDDDDDDGRRRLFIKGAMVKSFREAIAKAGAKGPRIGGTVTVAWTGEGEQANKALNKPKLFTVTYKVPAA